MERTGDTSDTSQQRPFRAVCMRCLKPASSCCCSRATPIDLRGKVKFVFLMHPKEAKRQRTGTGRLASLCLPESEILVGVDFSHNERLNDLLCDTRYLPVLLYPSPTAISCTDEGFRQAAQGKTILALIVDSTWACSKKVIKLSENLIPLTRVTFAQTHESLFTFKRQPKLGCVSTIETCYYLICEMQAASIVAHDASPEPLMATFKAMVRFQLEKQNERVAGKIPSTHATDWKYTTIQPVPNF